MSTLAPDDFALIRARQQRLVTFLRENGFAGALITTPAHVHYLSGHHPSRHLPGALWINADGAAHLSHAAGGDAPATVDAVVVYEGQRGGPLVDDAIGAAVEALGPAIAPSGKLAFDALAPQGLREVVNASRQLLKLRRGKDALEVRKLRESAAVLEAVYQHIREVLRPGMTEVDVCAECHAAAVRAAGAPCGWVGNDFQSNSPGGPPRPRAILAGELMPLDLGVGVNGYFADLSRTFCIGGEPTAAQQRLHRRVLDVFDLILPQLRPGIDCAALHRQALAKLDGVEGLSFPHHLGHGIGLAVHESPRLSVKWNDTLAEGDVITIEPGAYGESVRGGVRLENNYLITANGYEALSDGEMGL